MEMIQGKDQAKHDQARFSLRQIMKALDWWNEGGWKTSCAVGAIIQQKAQKVLGIKADMTSLRTEAGVQLRRLKIEVNMAKHVAEQRSQSRINMMPGKTMYPFNFTFASPFPSIIKGIALAPKTRREELEEMTDGQIREIFREKQAKEIKKDHINYILESEKEYK
jgi:hypothetical protein